MAYGESYEEFIAKFDKTAKKTTDDCYTPREIWEAVKAYVCNKYGITPEQIVRPFYPGGDYQKEDYRPGGVVVDNPPFSMVDKICTWYEERGIQYFLFSPGKRIMRNCENRTVIFPGVTIQYENGAKVNTEFVTNMEPGTVARTSPTLFRMLSSGKRQRKTERPDTIITFSDFETLARAGVEFSVNKEESAFQSAAGNYTVFGHVLMLSDTARGRFIKAKEEARKKNEEAGLYVKIKLSPEQEAIRKTLK